MLSRRQFFTRAGAVGVSLTAAVALPGAMSKVRVYANSLPPVRDTINGVLSFVVPGNDPYSRAQGMATDRPGRGVAGHPRIAGEDPRPGGPDSGPRTGVRDHTSGCRRDCGAAQHLCVPPSIRRFGTGRSPRRSPTSAPCEEGPGVRVARHRPTASRISSIKFVVNALPTLAAFAAYLGGVRVRSGRTADDRTSGRLGPEQIRRAERRLGRSDRVLPRDQTSIDGSDEAVDDRHHCDRCRAAAAPWWRRNSPPGVSMCSSWKPVHASPTRRTSGRISKTTPTTRSQDFCGKGPGDRSRTPWLRDVPQQFVCVAGRRRRRHHPALLR